MIHRFLLFESTFTCRLDRFYPLSSSNNSLSITNLKEKNNSASTARMALESNEPRTKQYGNWQILILDDNDNDEQEKAASKVQADLSNLSLGASSTAKQVEHSQKLLLGSTHSLRNMLLKLSPTVQDPLQASKAFPIEQGPLSLMEGYSFSFRTSMYRVQYFESFTGYRLILLTSDNSTGKPIPSAPTAYGPVNVDSCLKVLYGELIANYAMHYPLGAVNEAGEDDAFRRAGFLTRLDEYITSIDKLF